MRSEHLGAWILCSWNAAVCTHGSIMFHTFSASYMHFLPFPLISDAGMLKYFSPFSAFSFCLIYMEALALLCFTVKLTILLPQMSPVLLAVVFFWSSIFSDINTTIQSFLIVYFTKSILFHPSTFNLLIIIFNMYLIPELPWHVCLAT